MYRKASGGRVSGADAEPPGPGLLTAGLTRARPGRSGATVPDDLRRLGLDKLLLQPRAWGRGLPGRRCAISMHALNSDN